MRELKDEESDVEQQGQVGVLIRIQILVTNQQRKLGMQMNIVRYNLQDPLESP